MRDGVFSECAVVRFPHPRRGRRGAGSVAGIATDTTRLALATASCAPFRHLQGTPPAGAGDADPTASPTTSATCWVCITGYVGLALQRLDSDPEDEPSCCARRWPLSRAARASCWTTSGPAAAARLAASVALRALAEEALRLLAVRAPPSVRLTVRGTARDAAGDDSTLLQVLLNLEAATRWRMPAGGS
jgi:hypothetical protein